MINLEEEIKNKDEATKNVKFTSLLDTKIDQILNNIQSPNELNSTRHLILVEIQQKINKGVIKCDQVN